MRGVVETSRIRLDFSLNSCFLTGHGDRGLWDSGTSRVSNVASDRTPHGLRMPLHGNPHRQDDCEQNYCEHSRAQLCAEQVRFRADDTAFPETKSAPSSLFREHPGESILAVASKSGAGTQKLLLQAIRLREKAAC
jgi:hypothetical protein